MGTHRDAVFARQQEDGVAFLPALAGIYVILNRANHRVYVGQSGNIKKRCLKHRYELRRCDCTNVLMLRDAKLHGLSAFFYFAPRIEAFVRPGHRPNLNAIEVWFGTQLGSTDERVGYNLELGGHPTTATRFRNREMKLLRRGSGKYVMLPGVTMYDPINPLLLSTWVPGS